MDTAIISCKTIENELLAAMDECDCSYPVFYLESGLHNVPKKLNTKIQEYLDRCEGFDTVLLAMGFCGNAVVGLRTHDFQLVMPRCDDCISLLLGEQERPFATLFLTEGWLKSGQHLGQEYDSCMAKYGEKKGKRIFDTMLAHYQYLSMIDTGCFDTRSAGDEIRALSKKLGLSYTTVSGNLRYLKALLDGKWAEDEFVLVPPNSILTSDYLQ